MYNKVISKIRCHSPNQKNTPIRNYNTLYYIATREGVDLAPLSEEESDNATYARYIHERPKSNGLFGQNIDTQDINAICSHIRNISKSHCIYRGILSLSEEDAKQLGFLDKSAWNDYLRLAMPEIAETLGIPVSEMVWVAAFHKERGHPHVHYMLWDSNPAHIRSPFISVPQQHKCRELFSGRFFAEERKALNAQKTAIRNTIAENLKEGMQNDIQKLVSDICSQPSYQTLHRINQQFLDDASCELLKLTEHLPKSGSIKYAYLPPEVKKEVDLIVQHLISNPELQKEYNSFLNFHQKIAETYSPTKKELHVAILKGKEDIDRRLANVVLNAAKTLRKEKEIYYALQNTKLPSYQELLKDKISEATILALQSEAEKGDSQASYLLGRIYDDPNSGYYNPDQAITHYRKAVDNGNRAAKSILGSKYLWGKDVEHDETLGRKYLHEAQEEGDEYAKGTETAFDNYQKERANYCAVSLMTNLLQSLCYTNQTRCPSSVYHSGIDRNNKKAMKEVARKHQHKRSDGIEI